MKKLFDSMKYLNREDYDKLLYKTLVRAVKKLDYNKEFKNINLYLKVGGSVSPFFVASKAIPFLEKILFTFSTLNS
jgi:hypothetical protein